MNKKYERKNSITVSITISAEDLKSLRKRLGEAGITKLGRLFNLVAGSSETVIRGPGANVVVIGGVGLGRAGLTHNTVSKLNQGD
jgi:hypothetical protein